MKACTGMFGLGSLVVAFSISVLWGVNPASAKYCGCHAGSQWKCSPVEAYCFNECREPYKIYSDRASCIKGRTQSQARAQTVTTKSKPKKKP
jgi:hypothetical protein